MITAPSNQMMQRGSPMGQSRMGGGPIARQPMQPNIAPDISQMGQMAGNMGTAKPFGMMMGNKQGVPFQGGNPGMAGGLPNAIPQQGLMGPSPDFWQQLMQMIQQGGGRMGMMQR